MGLSTEAQLSSSYAFESIVLSVLLTMFLYFCGSCFRGFSIVTSANNAVFLWFIAVNFKSKYVSNVFLD